MAQLFVDDEELELDDDEDDVLDDEDDDSPLAEPLVEPFDSPEPPELPESPEPDDPDEPFDEDDGGVDELEAERLSVR
nr:hypothetical protein [Catenulispora pinistramenti]